MTSRVDRLNVLAHQLRLLSREIRPVQARPELRHIAGVASDLDYLADCIEQEAYTLAQVQQAPS